MKLDDAPCEHFIVTIPLRSWRSWFLLRHLARCLWCGRQWGPLKTESELHELFKQESR